MNPPGGRNQPIGIILEDQDIPCDKAPAGASVLGDWDGQGKVSPNLGGKGLEGGSRLRGIHRQTGANRVKQPGQTAEDTSPKDFHACLQSGIIGRASSASQPVSGVFARLN